MNRSRWLTACAAILSVAAAQGQLPLSPDINLFGDDLPQKNPHPEMHAGGAVAGKHHDKNKAASDNLEVLVFCDGRQLHGNLAEITAREVVWRRPDSNEALHFPRNEVRRIALTAALPGGQNSFPVGVPRIAGLDPSRGRGGATGPASGSMPATLKLPGGDWLFGEVATEDGEKFALQLEGGALVAIHRAQLEWLHFSTEPAPAIGYFGSPLDLEGWLPPSTAMEIARGTVTLEGAEWIGRAVSPPQRFEVMLEVPPEAEDGARLWLQPFGPQVNCFTTGTVLIEFGKKKITHQIFINQFDRQSSPYPKEAIAEKGPASYRIFCDGIAHITVQRNGRQVGDWKFDLKKDAADNEAIFRQMHVTGICFDRENHGAGNGLKFNRLRVQPWNGVLPGSGETTGSQDQLTLGDTTPIMGKLESMGKKEFVFSSEPRAYKAGAFVQFANVPAPLSEPLARVNLGRQGEFNVGTLEIRDGMVRCDTAFATGLEVPVDAVQAITFQEAPAAPQPPTDVLVFKNGDELSGHALAANSKGPVRWKSQSGQELEFQAGRIAGIRLAALSAAKHADPASTLELRNGERLRGNVLSLDEKQLQLQHPQLGALALDRSRLWHLFPSSTLEISDGGRDPESWMREAPGEPRRTPRKKDKNSTAWIYLDGTYILRNGGGLMSTNMEDWDGLQREIPAGLDRFEVRLEAYTPVAATTCLLLRLAAKDSGPTWQATVSFGEVQLVIFGQHMNRQPNWREIPLQEKLPDLNTRRAIRLFVDTKAGTTDLFINGVLIARAGQQPEDRLAPGKYSVRFQPYPNQGGPCVLSNLWVGPWTGELPRPGVVPDAATALNNGDAAPGTPKGLRDGKLAIDSDLGALEIPVDKVQEVDFGGKMLPEHTPGRLRLVDGSIVNVDQFEWDGLELSAHGPTVGDLRLPAGIVNEIIFDPPPLHGPVAAESKKLAHENHRAGEGLEAIPGILP